MTWQDCTLGDVVKLQRGHDLPDRLRVDGPVPVVSSSGVTGRHNFSKAEPPGVVTGRYGTIGEVFYVEEPYWPLNTALYVVDFKGNNPRFVAYLLRNTLRNYRSEKAAVPGVDRNVLHLLKVRVPDIKTQDRITTVLTAYDESVENNRRRIALLEESARLLYREWFIYLRFPGHEHVKVFDGVPEGWGRSLLFDEATATYGHAFKSELFNDDGVGLPVVRIRDVPSGCSNTWTEEDAPEDRRLANGDLLVGMDGEFHINFWCGGDAWLNQRVAKLGSKGKVSVGLLRFAIERPVRDFNETITGTTVKHLGDKHLKQVRLLIPPAALLDQANEVCESIRRMSVTLALQSRAVAQARNLLLPRLLSGEIAV